MAILTLDQRRIAARRDGCFPCVTVGRKSLTKAEEAGAAPARGEKTSSWVSRFSCVNLMGYASRIMRHLPVQVGVLLVTLSMLSACIYGTYNTKIDFQHKELLTYDSYLRLGNVTEMEL